MAVQTRPSRTVTLSPQEPLVAGGPAEAFEHRVQSLFDSGHLRLVVDLAGVARMDSEGIRALVRGHTTAQRLGGSFTLTRAPAHVRQLFAVTHLDSTFDLRDSITEAESRHWSPDAIRLSLVTAVIVTAFLLTEWKWPFLPTAEDLRQAGGKLLAPDAPSPVQPFADLVRFAGAAVIGLLVAAVQRRERREKPRTRAMEEAQVLLCMSGAMMMIIIGNSLVRAFGIAGAASIIRFRTPVDDPKDSTVLFLLMGLGMSVGLGAFAFAGLGTAFLCIFLLALDRFGGRKPRVLMVEIATDRRGFPSAQVETIFARHRVVFEPRQISQGAHTVARYHVTLDPNLSLESLSEELMADELAGIVSVDWQPPKKSE